jgi:hypothetical protein
LGQSELRDHRRVVVGPQDVGRVQVAMDDLPAVGGMDRPRQRSDQLRTPHLAMKCFDLLEQEVPPQLLRQPKQLQPAEPGQARLRPEVGVSGRNHASAPQQRAQGVLGPGPLGDPLAAAVDQLAPGPHVERGHVDRRRLAQVQQLGQPLRVLAVVLVPGAVMCCST